METLHQHNLFFLSGPHGSGKTTLGKRLAEHNPLVFLPELYSRNVKFDTDPEPRMFLKLCGRAIENFEYMKIASENPHRLIIGNRCIYDALSYNKVYLEKGWISRELFDKINNYSNDFFVEKNPSAIIVNPGFDVIKNHLLKRWSEAGKKWREDDLEYLHLACKTYACLRENKDILYVEQEIDHNDMGALERICDWMMQKSQKKGMKIISYDADQISQQHKSLCVSPH